MRCVAAPNTRPASAPETIQIATLLLLFILKPYHIRLGRNSLSQSGWPLGRGFLEIGGCLKFAKNDAPRTGATNSS